MVQNSSRAWVGMSGQSAAAAAERSQRQASQVYQLPVPEHCKPMQRPEVNKDCSQCGSKQQDYPPLKLVPCAPGPQCTTAYATAASRSICHDSKLPPASGNSSCGCYQNLLHQIGLMTACGIDCCASKAS